MPHNFVVFDEHYGYDFANSEDDAIEIAKMFMSVSQDKVAVYRLAWHYDKSALENQ